MRQGLTGILLGPCTIFLSRGFVVNATILQEKSRSLRRAGLRTLLSASVLLSVSACVFAFDQAYERKYPLAAGGSFELANVNGSVQVDGWERDEVEIRAVKTADGDERDLDRVSIEVEAQGNHVAVRTRYPRGGGVAVAVDYHVHVPYRVLLSSVATVNGSVSIRGVEGVGDVRSVNGNVEVTDSSGRFSAHATNGNIHLQLRRLFDGSPMLLETVNGSIVLGLPQDAQAELRANSMNGDLYSELPVTAHGAYSQRGFHGTLGAGGGTITARTVNGGIRILLEHPAI